MARLACAVVLASALVAGCQQPEIIDEVETGDFAEVLPFETLGIGQRASHTERVERLVRTAEEWEAASSTLMPFEAFEDVDFEQVMLAVVVVPVESGGWTIEVESVERAEGAIEIAYVLGEPGVDCITPTALATPFQVIRIRKLEDVDVTFSSRKERFSCKDF